MTQNRNEGETSAGDKILEVLITIGIVLGAFIFFAIVIGFSAYISKMYNKYKGKHTSQPNVVAKTV
jgi:hypothetical protein